MPNLSAGCTAELLMGLMAINAPLQRPRRLDQAGRAAMAREPGGAQPSPGQAEGPSFCPDKASGQSPIAKAPAPGRHQNLNTDSAA